MNREIVLPYFLANSTPLVLSFLAAKDWAVSTVVFLSLISFALTSLVFLRQKRDETNFAKQFPRLIKPQAVLWLFLGQSFLVTIFVFLSLPHIQQAIDNLAVIIGLRLLLLFHVLEFVGIIIFRPSQLEPDSFLLYNAVAYQIAIGIMLGELFLENQFCHTWKVWASSILLYPKVLIAIAGLGIRFIAFWNLGTDFDHALFGKRDNRKLITSGIHSLERHPSYVGFWIFTVALNAIFFNIFHLFFATTVLFFFYKKRIIIEERLMKKTFGDQFTSYAARVPSLFDFWPALMTHEAPTFIQSIVGH
jgi:protein-S-isoprenylcysteine O-methyltransferase